MEQIKAFSPCFCSIIDKSCFLITCYFFLKHTSIEFYLAYALILFDWLYSTCLGLKIQGVNCPFCGWMCLVIFFRIPSKILCCSN